MTQLRKLVAFVDGENLTTRYQKILSEGRIASPKTIHEIDTYVWHPGAIVEIAARMEKVFYYTTVVGDSVKVRCVEEGINSLIFNMQSLSTYNLSEPVQGTLYPKVYKKPRKSQKTAAVDINMVLDMMHFAHTGDFEIFYLITGDGDFKPLVEELVRLGKHIYVAALSEGLNSNLPRVADKFIDLDDIFFEKIS